LTVGDGIGLVPGPEGFPAMVNFEKFKQIKEIFLVQLEEDQLYTLSR
jgi:hypothetical protein